MKLKLSKIALAVAVLSTAPAAFALTPADIRAAGTSVKYVWLSGASAPSNSVFRSVVLNLCKDANNDGKPDDAHVYIQSTGKEPGKSSGDRVAYACTLGANAGSLANEKVVVYHTVENGSFNAYSPHLKIAGDNNPELLPSLQRIEDLTGLDAGGKCANGAAVVDLPAPLDTVGRYNNCTLTTRFYAQNSVKLTLNGADIPNPKPGVDYPDGGFSDTEYLINKQNLAIGKDLSEIGSEVATNVGQGFGVAVSYPLYYRLQQNDVNPSHPRVAGHGALPASCITGFSATAPNLTPACQPSLPAQRYTTVAGRDSIFAVDGSLFGGPANTVVNLVRRVPTSGTQSASNARFLAKPSATGLSQGALEPARISDSIPGQVVVTEWPSTGGVKTELNRLSSLSGQYGLGVVSLENVPGGAAANDRWAFVKLNRVSPDQFPDKTVDPRQRAEALDGSYDFWYELVAFTASGASPASAAGADLIAAISTTLGEHALDLTGLFATPLSSLDLNDPKYAVSYGGRFGNSSQPQVQ